MASLRRKPADAVVATDDVTPDVAIAVETNAPPGQPEQPQQDDATLALKRQIAAIHQGETMQQQAAIAQLAANERRQAWLESTPGAKDNIPALGAFHHAALNAGLVDTSPEYFDFMGAQLAALNQPAEAATHLAEEMQQRAAQERAPEPPAKPRGIGSIVSAPVSRDVPISSTGKRQTGKITITPQEVEHARVAGISIEEYARQKMRLAAMRASGEYGGSEDQRR